MWKTIGMAATLSALIALPLRAETITLTSLEWPPFTGADVPGQGMNAALVRKVLKVMGHDLRVLFFPWKRTVAEARNGRTHGYFPEYPSDENEAVVQDFACSNSIGNSVLGFVQHRSRPVTWKTLQDLTQHRIGVVDGYLNEPEFDRMVASGLIRVEPVKSDLLNLRKIVGRTIRLAVIDKAVMRYLLLLESADDAAGHPLIAFNDKPLAINTLHVCFSRRRDGEAMRAAFDRVLARFDVNAINDDYLSSTSF